MNRRPPPLAAVDILSDDDVSAFSPSPLKKPKRSAPRLGGSPPTFLVIDDDPTPQKPYPNPNPNFNLDRTPSFVADTPLSSDVSIVKCSLKSSVGLGSDRPSSSSVPDKFSGITNYICLESDNESGDGSSRGSLQRPRFDSGNLMVGCSKMKSRFSTSPCRVVTSSEKDHVGFCSPKRQDASPSSENDMEVTARYNDHSSFDGCSGSLKLYNKNLMQSLGDSAQDDLEDEDAIPQAKNSKDEEGSMFGQADNTVKQKRGRVSSSSNKDDQKNVVAARKKQQKEEKARMLEEKNRKRQEEKLQREAMKAEAAEQKKLEKEKQKWEKGKFAIKSIVAEVDTKVVENGSIGGHLLTRFAEKGLSFRIMTNPIERSILWKMSVPDQIAQLSSIGSEVPYVLLVYQAEEFCELVSSDSLIGHVNRVQSLYPSSTVCYATNKLMSYINKCEQNQYKNPAKIGSWRRPPVEEVLSKLTTHFTNVHSRQCIDEAELAEHIVGLTSGLANCQFRKKLTKLSINANGLIVPKDFIDRKLIKKNIWLKALVAIPKVQPRHAISIWKRYPTMRSLLNVYMDPNKSVHEKEFLLKDLMIEGLLGKEDRRLGEMCSKRVYRILMAQSGGIKTDDVEDGADAFGC